MTFRDRVCLALAAVVALAATAPASMAQDPYPHAWNVNGLTTKPQRGDRRPKVEAREGLSKHDHVSLLD